MPTTDEPVSRPDLPRRRRILLTMLAAARFRYDGPPPELVRLLRGWFDSWAGIGRIAGGMARQGYDLQLTRYGEHGWRATFYAAGGAHSLTSAVGSSWARTPWEATQEAAGATLMRAERAA
jgi:hypothetical protein